MALLRLLSVIGAVIGFIVCAAFFNAFAICCLLLFVLALLITRLVRLAFSVYYFSWFIYRFGMLKTVVPNASELRSHFRDTPMVKLASAMNHTHPRSAAVRNAAARFADYFSKLIGHPAYFLSMSAADVRNSRQGSREYYWAKDLNVAPSEYEPGPRDLVVLCDVDMYVDMLHLLSDPRCYLISTFQPAAVAYVGPEFSFCFNADQSVSYDVAGGAQYRHPVWNYSGDTFAVEVPGWFGSRYVAYTVDRRTVSPHHELIFLVPIAVVDTWFGSAMTALRAPELRRLSPVIGDYSILTFQRGDGRVRSYGRPGQHLACELSVQDDNALAGLAKVTATKLSSALAKSHLGDRKLSELITIVEYHREHHSHTSDLLFPVAESVHVYHFEPESFDPDTEGVVRPFCHPLYDGCFAPAKDRASDQRFVNGRLNEVKPDVLELTDLIDRCMNEFVERLIRVAGKLLPSDIDEVFARQNRPTQRSILAEAVETGEMFESDTPIKSFVKAEAYSELNDPRGISTIMGKTKLHYSRYMYALMELVSKEPWYAFGKTPLEIAQRVVEICSDATTVVNTDLSRFDGRVSNLLRRLEMLVCVRAFSDEYHAELLSLMGDQMQQNGRTRFGVTYETGFSRLSGSPETAVFNTIANAFMAYLSYRMTRVGGAFIGPDEAYARLGIYGGDDGLTADCKPALYMKACASVGQLLEVESVERGDFGVTFLSRYYSPYVWFGDLNSMCDVPRQLKKLHACSVLPPNVTPMQKLAEKLSGYYMTDSNTPVLGELAIRLVRERGLSSFSLGIANYFAYYPEHEQYPNEDTDWMDAACYGLMPDFDFHRFRIWMFTHHDVEDMLNFPLCNVLSKIKQPKEDLVVDGDVVKGAKPSRQRGRGRDRRGVGGK